MLCNIADRKFSNSAGIICHLSTSCYLETSKYSLTLSFKYIFVKRFYTTEAATVCEDPYVRISSKTEVRKYKLNWYIFQKHRLLKSYFFLQSIHTYIQYSIYLQTYMSATFFLKGSVSRDIQHYRSFFRHQLGEI